MAQYKLSYYDKACRETVHTEYEAKTDKAAVKKAIKILWAVNYSDPVLINLEGVKN